MISITQTVQFVNGGDGFMDKKFVKSTVILICANAIAKILGAVFKIPLTYILKEDGMAIYNTAFSVYAAALSIVCGGFPFALKKIISEYYCADKGYKIRSAVLSVGVVLGVIGALASVVLFFASMPLAMSMREPEANLAIKVISASVFFVAVGMAYKSSNEALANHIPTAISQVTEAVFKLFLGYYLAKMLIQKSSTYATCGAVLGVTAGEAFATVLLFLMWKKSVRGFQKGSFSIYDIQSATKIAIPLIITGSALGAFSMCEVSVIRGGLSAVRFTRDSAELFLNYYAPKTSAFDDLLQRLRFSQNGVRTLFGAYSGYAQTIVNLPIGIIATVFAASTQNLTKALAKNEGCDIACACKNVAKPIFLLSFPATALCMVFAKDILKLLFGTDLSALMLVCSAPVIVFSSLNGLLFAVFHLYGRVYEPFFGNLSALAIKMVLLAVLIRIPQVNILGAGIAGVVASAFMLAWNLKLFKKIFSVRLGLFKLSLPYMTATCMLVGVARLFSPFFSFYLSGAVSLFASVAVGAVGYILSVILLIK